MDRAGPPALIAIVLLLAVGAPGAAAETVPGRLIVGFEPRADIARIVERAGATLERRHDRIRAATVRVRRGTTGDLRRRLLARGGVRYVEPDHILDKSATPDDPLFAAQYALQPGTAGISATQAWDQRTSCALVAVLDSGTQYDHPDLKPNIWHNSQEVKANGKDDDDNGYVDDYYGVNIEKGSGSGGDGDGHGTHVAGIIGGQGDNATGIAGACWKAKIMPIRFMNSSGRGSTSDAVEGLDYAIHEQAKVVNCSFGSSSKSSALDDAIQAAKEKGVLVVVAAGNDGDNIDSSPIYPASYTHGNIITVAATTSTGALASFSNYGAKAVDMAAPGDKIYSTYPTSDYRSLSGTSMAAPYVAASAAMLRSKNPDLTYSQIRSALKASADALPALAGKTVTGARLDLLGALAQAR
jgi:subtilisin family serine protease